MDDNSSASLVIDEAFHTDDIHLAERTAQRVYPRAQLRDSHGAFLYEQFARGADGVNFTRFKINSQMDIEVEFHEVAAFGLLLGGRYEVQSNRERVDSSHPFLFSPGIGGSHSEELDVLMVNIDTEVLERLAAKHLGVEHVRLAFHGSGARSDALRTHWLRTIHYAWNSVIQVDEVFGDEMIRSVTLETVATAALAAFPIETPSASRSSTAALSGAVRRAQRHIAEHAHEPLTVGAIAMAARLSVRGLQDGFRRELGTTPLGYLRRIRLQEARRELTGADASESHVAAIARRWGFANPGRFAADYRVEFGEYPAQTLRR